MALSLLDNQLAGYEGMVEALAERRARRHPDELDDLMQEGRILVWKLLGKGVPVTEQKIDNRMRGWIKYRSRQRRDIPTDYEKLLPIGELRDVNAQKVAVRELPGAGPDATE